MPPQSVIGAAALPAGRDAVRSSRHIPARAVCRRRGRPWHPARLRLGVLAFVLCLVPRAAQGQQASMQGIVTSSSTGSPMEGVAVVLEAGGQRVKTVLTDRNGFYQIGGITPGSYTLSGLHIGYSRYELSLTLASGERRTANFTLQLAPVELKGIVVTPERGAAVRDLGRQVVTPAEIRAVPVPAGSGDLATYLQTLPGVTTTGDRGGQLYVRGGTPAQNLALVDGIQIYQPYHILGFFSVFPEDLVSSADFYAGNFGARYSGRTSSVLDVRLRDGNPNRYRGMLSVSPFLAEGMAEGPAGNGLSWLASVRHSLVEQTSEHLMGALQPYGFDSQLLKVTATNGEAQRCSGMALRTSDRGRLDPAETTSHVEWQNLVVGGHCVTQGKGILRLTEVNVGFSSFDNAAVSRGSSIFRSGISRLQADAHITSMIGTLPLYAGFHISSEGMTSDLTEIFGIAERNSGIFGTDVYGEAGIPLGTRGELRPGLLLTALPIAGAEPRVRMSWEPFGRASEKIQAALGVYRQSLLGTSDLRDVTNVFVAWMTSPDDIPMQSVQGSLGWQQSLGGGVNWSIEGYFKRMRDIPVPAWNALPQFTTRLVLADGRTHGLDARLQWNRPHFYGFLGYGYSWTEYQVTQPEFVGWFGDSVQSYHPPHDRRHQVNAVASADLAGFKASARWQFGTGLPFTQPLGFDEAFDYWAHLWDPGHTLGTERLLLDRPFNGRLPTTHRLDLSLERSFNLPVGQAQLQAGAVNVYNRRNMFYYDLFTARRADQLPRAPYLSLTLRSK